MKPVGGLGWSTNLVVDLVGGLTRKHHFWGLLETKKKHWQRSRGPGHGWAAGGQSCRDLSRLGEPRLDTCYMNAKEVWFF